ncbi:MAG: putative toxin-antitoxin system toxin component, PIN family [Verrucomicrobia bacterium]|jgi:putative PIN family toxin of toxin-antitoxin system|nr:putative toxin-antitoxin system toxin component, PIN family [Verrucomicrobiota bacterium]
MSDAQAVIDTNVFVSGMIQPFGAPGQLLDALLNKRLKIAYDDRLLLEYREVLMRPRFSFDPKRIEEVLNSMLFQNRVSAHPWVLSPSPDPDDTMFLEVAATADAPLVSGNLKHFPPECRGPVAVMTPADFLVALGSP